MRWQRWFLLGAAATVVVIAHLLTAAPATSTADAAAPTYQKGIQYVPEAVMTKAIEEFNGRFCSQGRLDTVPVAGASTKGDVVALLPKLGLASAWPHLTDATPIYAAVFQGDCIVEEDSGARPAVQGYALFNDDGFVLYGRVWYRGLETQLDEPFGDATDDALKL